MGLRRGSFLAQALGGRRVRGSGGVTSATGSRLRVAVAAAAAEAARVRATWAPLGDEAGDLRLYVLYIENLYLHMF